MSAGSEYVSPAEDWYRGQYRQQQERFQERQDELQARDLVDVVSYSLSNERHRTILPHQQHYAHFYPQVPPPSQNRYSLSSFDSHERYAPRPIQQHQHQQHTQLAPIHPYVPPPIIRAEPSPYSSQRIFLDDAAFSPSQYSPGSSAANTPFLYHPSSHSTSQSFYHQQITHNEGIHPIESREYCEEETRDCDESGLGQHRRTYEATRHPLFGYTQEPTVEQGYFPLVDSERYDTIVDDSQYSPSPPLPDYTPIPFAYPAPKHISPISLRAHRHIYEEPSIDYQPASPSQSPSPGPSTQHDVESSFHVARVQDYPSPQDEDRFKTAPASPPLSPLTDLTESDVDANGEDVDEGEGETRSASPTTAVSMLSGEHAEGEDADGEGEELDVETGVDTTDPPFRTDPDEAMAEELIGTTKSISPLYPPEPQPRRPRAARSIVPSSEVGHVSSILDFFLRSSLTSDSVRSECRPFHLETRLDSPQSRRIWRYDLLEVSHSLSPPFRFVLTFSSLSVKPGLDSPSLPARHISSITSYRHISRTRVLLPSHANSTSVESMSKILSCR